MTELVILGPFSLGVAHVEVEIEPVFLCSKKTKKRCMAVTIHTFERGMHFRGVWVESFGLLLIAFTFSENAVDEGRYALICGLIETRITVGI